MSGKTLRINEIFLSIQGESSKTGLPTIFIRLTGCPLRCNYCDTEYAFYEGKKMELAEILETISCYHTRHITVTGGEPLAQKNCHLLLTALCDKDYQVSLETSGAMPIKNIDDRVIKILDLKTPASGEAQKNKMDNIDYLTRQDQVKFVICNHDDYEWSKSILKKYHLYERCEVLFAPSHAELAAVKLADWILEDQVPVRLQIQLHKYLWGDKRGR